MFKITDIRHKETNETRTDGRYPLRIGSVINFYVIPTVGSCAFLDYVSDNEGNFKGGLLRTSVVESILEDSSELILTTHNSIYIFEKL